jgi:hypothetical protein
VGVCPIHHPEQCDVGQGGDWVAAADVTVGSSEPHLLEVLVFHTRGCFHIVGWNGRRFSSMANAWKAASTVVLRSVS